LKYVAQDEDKNVAHPPSNPGSISNENFAELQNLFY
jgi:hypothetical protein